MLHAQRKMWNNSNRSSCSSEKIKIEQLNVCKRKYFVMDRELNGKFDRIH